MPACDRLRFKFVSNATPQTRWRTTTEILDGLADSSNGEVWTTFVNRHRPLMIGYLRKLGLNSSIAEEVAQQTLCEFAAAYARGVYDRRKGGLRNWLFGIARNQLSNLRRSAARNAGDAREGCAETFLDDPGEAIWETEYRQFALRSCFSQLTQEVSLDSMEAFRLFCIQGVPAAQVALALGMSENAVYLNKRRMLRRIRELLCQLDDEYADRDSQEPGT